MVRHEAAEAMGATPLVQSVPTLKDFLDDERREVRETCEIASSGTIWKEGRNDETSRGEPVGLPVYVYFPYLCIYFFFADSSYLKIQHTPCLRRSFDHRPVQARPT